MGIVLTRKVGESIMVGDDIKIMVVGFREKHIKLNFTA